MGQLDQEKEEKGKQENNYLWSYLIFQQKSKKVKTDKTKSSFCKWYFRSKRNLMFINTKGTYWRPLRSSITSIALGSDITIFTLWSSRTWRSWRSWSSFFTLLSRISPRSLYNISFTSSYLDTISARWARRTSFSLWSFWYYKGYVWGSRRSFGSTLSWFSLKQCLKVMFCENVVSLTESDITWPITLF